MPDDKTPGVDLDTYQKEKDEFEDEFNKILEDESDDKSGDDKDKDKSTDKAGEATGDPEKDSKSTDKTSDLSKQTSGLGQPPAATEPVEDDKDTDWKARALEAESKLKDLEAELAKEVQKTKSWNGRITAANKRVKELEDELAKVKADRPTREQLDREGKIAKFKDDFPEFTEFVDAMQQQIDEKTTPAKVEPEPTAADADDQTVDPVDNTNDNDNGDEPTEHYTTITEAHPDIDEILNTGVLMTWIRKQNKLVQPHLENLFQKGSAEQLIEMVNQFKEQTGWKSQLDTGEDEERQKKLDALKAVDSDGSGPPAGAPDKNDYHGAAKEAGL